MTAHATPRLSFLVALALPALVHCVPVQELRGQDSRPAPTVAPKSSFRVEQFLPAEYIGVMRADRKRMEEIELWDGLARSPLMNMANGQVRRDFGVSIADIDSLHSYPGNSRSGEVGGYRGALVVLRGEGLSLEAVEKSVDSLDQRQVRRTERDGLAVVEMLSWPGDDTPKYYLMPEPGVLVMGDRYIVEPVLDGTRRGVGVPHANLMPLQGIPGALVELAFHFPAGMERELGRSPLPLDFLDAADPIMNVVARLVESGDGESVILEMFVDFKKADINAPKVATLATEGLATLAGHRQFGALKRIWNAVKVEQDGARVRATLGLGNSRQAVGTLSQLLAPAMALLFTSTSAGPVVKPQAKVGK